MNEYNVNGNRNRVMPKEVRLQCEWILKDYNRLKGLANNASLANEAEDAVVFYADDCEGLTPQSVILEAQVKVEVIENSLEVIPEAYRNEIFEYYTCGNELPDYASINTWKKWKKAYLLVLARKLKLY